MKKLLIILALVIALLVLAAGTTWWWLTQTRGGAEWALNRAAGQLEQLTWSSLEGGLAGGITLHDVEFAQAGTRVRVDRLQLAARVRPLAGPRVDVHWLRAGEVDVHLAEAVPDEPVVVDRVEVFDPAVLASPVAVDVAELTVRALRIHPHDGETVEIRSIDLAGHFSDRLELDRLKAEADPGRLSGRGQWSLTEPFAGQLDLLADLHIDDQTEQAIEMNLSGRLEDLNLEIEGRGPAELTGSARVRGLPKSISGRVQLAGRLADWPGLELVVDDIDLDAQGDLDQWQLSLAASTSGMDLPPGRWHLNAEAAEGIIRLDRLDGELLDGRVFASGQLDLGADRVQADAEIRLDSIDLTPLYPDWPDQARVSGQLAGRMEGDDIYLDRIDLEAPPTTLKVSGEGRFAPATDELDLQLQWRDFNWPPVLDDREPLIHSESGRVSLTGRISDWQLELDALLRQGELPAGELGLRAWGDEQQAHVEELLLQLRDAGQLSAAGRIQWSPAPDLEIDVSLDQFDPGVFVYQLPGQVDARLALEARRTDDWLIGIRLDQLSGQLRGEDLVGSGSMRIAEDLPEAARLEVSLGDNHLAIDSDDGRFWKWRLDAGAVGQLWPETEGAVRLEGTLDPFDRQLDAQGLIESAGYREIALTRTELDARLDWGEVPSAEVRLRLAELDLKPWERIDQLELTFQGGCSDHLLELNLSGQRGSVDLAARGQLDGCLAGPEAWQASIERLYLGETQAGSWQLSRQLPIRITEDWIVAGPGCLMAVGDDGQLCLEELMIDGDSRLRLGIKQVPMDLLLLPLDPVFSLTTPLSGELQVDWSAQRLKRLAGHLELASGALMPLGGEDALLNIEGVRLDFSPQDAHGLEARLLARLEGDTELTSVARIPDLRDLTEATLEAEGRLDLPDVGAFNHLVTELDQLGGRLAGEIRLAGRLTSPDFDGSLKLSDGFLVHAPMGLKVSDIDIELEGRQNQATLNGSMQSGDGRLGLDGRLSQQPDGWTLVADLDGDNVALADVDWLRLSASPSINVEARQGEMRVDGDIRIDRLRAGLPPGAGERVTPSADVIVIGEEDEEDVDQPIRRMYGRLGIVLGDDARMSAVGLQTRLAGGVELLWNGSPEPRGRGVVRLPEGSYRAYGQNLSIRDGEILFTGHPLDNPRLDIRAVREIFGDPRVEAAGVHIRGPAQKPQIELFTNPPTSDEKALGYVVTGADFDHAGGQAALNVGYYLLPRLFVSYGIGLFEAGNVVSGRYQLTDRWGVRVVSGQRDTGVDLGYITDR